MSLFRSPTKKLYSLADIHDSAHTLQAAKPEVI